MYSYLANPLFLFAALSSFTRIPFTEAFAIHDNQLVGEIALGFCALRIDGQLQHLEADCASPADGGTVSCVCCTQCYPRDDIALPSMNKGDDDSGANQSDDWGNPSVPDPPTPSPTPAPTSQPPSPAPTPEPTPSPTAGPTPAPTTFTPKPTSACGGISQQAWKEAVANGLAGAGTSSRSTLLTNGSPQAKALRWILNTDPMQLCPGDERIEQRYLAALFFYSTNGGNWLDKGSGNQRYLGSAGECYWTGIKCNAYGEITHIEFGKWIDVTCMQEIMLSFLHYLTVLLPSSFYYHRKQWS